MGMCVSHQTRDAGAPGQAARSAWLGAALVACLASTLTLGGCGAVDAVENFYSTKLPLDTPVDWWHQLEGGVIADERPPPPGVGDPYPNLGQIPGKPTPTDAPTRRALSVRLAGERDRTTRQSAQDPILPLPNAAAAAAPAKPVASPPAPADPPPMAARIEAADARRKRCCSRLKRAFMR